ncbi:MAG TPA: hypothetical protein VFY46_03260, partial [Acidimicrobiia bacterium]|nr:hypothetical protein [Acidimicrobiia bacterium]
NLQSVLQRHVYWLSLLLAFVAAAATALTFFVPGILAGPAVTNGNARGTALVMLAIAVPGLLLSMWMQSRGSWRALIAWLGFLGYLLYNSFLLLFLTPVNRLFLLYVAAFSLAVFSVVALLRTADIRGLSERLQHLPFRGLAVYIWTVVVLNVLAWMRTIAPALLEGDMSPLVEGSGVATNPIYIQDLGFWLPLMAVTAWWLWRRRAWAIYVSGAWLCYGVLESAGVAVDQWFGHQADATSPLATVGAIWLMSAMAVVGLVPVYFYFRRSRRLSVS